MTTTAAFPAPRKPPPPPLSPPADSSSSPWVASASPPTSPSPVPTVTVNVTSSTRVPSTSTADSNYALDFASILPGSASRSTSASTSPPPSRASSPPPSTTSVPSTAASNLTNNDPHTRIFTALLAGDAPVDERKLRRAARAGIPPHARPAAWNVLLGVTSTTTAIHSVLDLDPSTSATSPTSTPSTTSTVLQLDGDGQIPRRVRKVLTKSRAISRGFGLPPSQNETDDSVSDTTLSSNGSATVTGMPGNSASIVRNNSGTGFANGSTVDIPSRRSSRSPPPLASRHSSSAFTRDDEAPIEAASASVSVRHRRRHHNLHHARPTVDSQTTAVYTSIVSTYMENAPPHVTYDDHLVTLCIPFVHVMPTPSDAYQAFCALMRHQVSFFAQSGLLDAVSNFLAMFRISHPDLYDLFAAEDVDMKRWARDWLRGLLVEQLPSRSLLRLWDSYFAAPTQDEGILLHPYVCLVFVQHLKPQLLDCDDAERINAILASLPPIDIDHIIAHAVTARQQLRDRNIV